MLEAREMVDGLQGGARGYRFGALLFNTLIRAHSWPLFLHAGSRFAIA